MSLIFNIIKEISELKKISIPELAKKAKMSKAGFYSALKNNTLKIESLILIADFLEIEIGYFFTGIVSNEKNEKIKEQEKKISDLKDELLQKYREIVGLENTIDIIKKRSTFIVYSLFSKLINNDMVSTVMNTTPFDMCFDNELIFALEKDIKEVLDREVSQISKKDDINIFINGKWYQRSYYLNQLNNDLEKYIKRNAIKH